MDENIKNDKLKAALEFSNYRITFAVQKQALQEKIDAKLTYGHNGGIFKIDSMLLVFVQNLLDNGRTEGVVLLDSKNNPILVDDLQTFKDEIYDRYFTSLNEYYQEYEKMKKSRSVERLLDV
jgi:hypothetical protein